VNQAMIHATKPIFTMVSSKDLKRQKIAGLRDFIAHVYFSIDLLQN
jgi:uncharacterized protein with HEPN domain